MAARRDSEAKPGEGSKMAKSASVLLDFLKAHAPAEDLVPYDAATLSATAELAHKILLRHKAGESLVSVKNVAGIERQGRAMSVVTVVNDNMPFLFNSVMGEITQSVGEPTLVLHPVLAVKHGKSGVSELLGDTGPGKADDGVDRVSLIHVHIPRQSDAECKALAERLQGVLKKVRAPSRTGSRCSPASIRRSATSAMPPCRWPRRTWPRRSPSSNGCATTISPSWACANIATAAAKRPASGAHAKAGSRHPARSRRAGAAARRPAGHGFAGDPRLPAWPRTADRHQGERQVGRPPPHLSRLYRHQDLRRRRADFWANCASSACSPRLPIRARC
jgi:hypothetical protein